MLSLINLFGEVAQKAFDILDRNCILVYKKQNFTIVEISGKNALTYKIFPNINYCSCPSFKFQVLGTQQQYTCKHILAAALALCTGNYKEEIITEQQFNVILKNIHEDTICSP